MLCLFRNRWGFPSENGQNMWRLSFWRFMRVGSGNAGYLNWCIMILWLNIESFCDSVIKRSFDKSIFVLTLYLNALDLTHYIIQINSHFVMKLKLKQICWKDIHRSYNIFQLSPCVIEFWWFFFFNVLLTVHLSNM